MAKTIAFDRSVQGWTSEYSFMPDAGVSLNNNFYTFHNGIVYIHNASSDDYENVFFNTFYGRYAPTELQLIFNEQPSSVKMFKTIALEAKGDWDVAISTNLQNGTIDATHFKDIEGRKLAFIRGENNNFTPDFKSANVGGVGVVGEIPGRGIWDPDDAYEVGDHVTIIDVFGNIIHYVRLIAGTTPENPADDSDLSSPTSNWILGIRYVFKSIPSSISIGDLIYASESNGERYDREPRLTGRVTGLTSTSITITSLELGGREVYGLQINDFVMYVKDNIVETSGILGFYAIVTLTNDQMNDETIDPVEIFSAGTETFISTA